MSRSPPRDELEQVASQVSEVIDRLWQWHSSHFCPVDTWSPSVNVYRVERHFDICVDLAGLQPKSIDVRVEPGRLVIRGYRTAPEPRRTAGEMMRIVTMEIDHGPFCRTIALSDQIDVARVESEYHDGWLWIRLPLREPG